MHDPASGPPDAGLGWRAFGVLLIVAGIFLTVVSGVCTTAILLDPSGGPELGDLSGAALVIGGPFILVGVLLWWGGVRAFRKGKRARAAAQTGAVPVAAGKPPEPPATT
jgi:hypothetical protein